ncbi:MAG TPA: condensation domain-containing protein, partial [Thermoanaerobaculia bacterium]
LMRVMLGGHPDLFAPPELELLSFNTLAERKAAFSGRDSFWLEGLLRALMEVRGCGAEEARTLMEQMESEGLSTAEMYRRLQEWLGRRMLVDKTPSYALDPAILRRAEEAFDQPRYIHLIRHPLGMIRSFEEAKLDQIFFRHEHPFSRRALAELIWLASERNIVEFLQEIPPERQHWVRFEELVREPERVLSGICAFLGLDYHPDMALPYKAKSERMTDGIHAESRMLGDVKFHQHRDVDAAVAERWREELSEDSLGEPTRETAARLGYSFTTSGGVDSLEQIEPQAWEPGTAAPLSFAQERLWFLDRFDPGSPTYNIPAALRLRGRLDQKAMELSLGEIVRRHAVLRTSFTFVDGAPSQVIAPAWEPALPLVDLSGLPHQEREAGTSSLATEEALRPFDLSRGPLLRVTLLRLAQDEHAALLTMHHIVADGWSLGLLIQEFCALYESYTEGRPSPLRELPIQYADYAVWQRRRLSGETLDRLIDTWKARLAGAPQALELPTDRPRPTVQSFHGGATNFEVDEATAALLRRLASSQGTTLFMVLLAAFQALLHRYSGQDDLVVGSTIAGRTRKELEKLIGFFVNTLAMRIDLSADPCFSGVVARVRETSIQAYALQEMPFEKLVAELQMERDLSRAPVFQVVFQVVNTPRSAVRLPNLTVEPVEAEAQTAKFDLVVNVLESGHKLFGIWRYNRDLFDPATAVRMSSHFRALLKGVAADPEARLSELPLLTGTERQQLLEWGGTGAGSPVFLLHERFTRQAARSPEAPAVVFEGERLSYGELDRRATRLAQTLRAWGVGPGELVALCLERSPEIVVAILGVLKAGATYVPIDPDYPAERIGFLLADSAAPVLLSQKRAAAGLPEHGCRTLLLDEGWEAQAPAAREALPAVPPESPAYVIYTSGSTGRPKGVVVSHAHVARLFTSTEAWFGFGPEDVWTLFHSYAFDFSVWEIWGALLHGGRLVVVPYWVSRSPEAFHELLRQEQVTVLNQTPSAFRQLLRADETAPAG